MDKPTIKLAHGSGGVLTHRLIQETVLKHFRSDALSSLPDSATLAVAEGRIAFTTDTYTVDPLFFPGGDIGKLAVCGTVNDLAVAGAVPAYISCALVLEEGLPRDDLERVLASMERAAQVAGVEVVTGDTKVVPKGQADRIFINTSGIGVIPEGAVLPDGKMRPGDVVVVSGPLGDHGAAVLSAREDFALESDVASDCAPVTPIARAILHSAERVSFLRDVTRGGLATILNEAVAGGGLGIVLNEEDVPVRPAVRSLCELLGLDPLYLDGEGRVAAVVDAESAEGVVRAARSAPGGESACIVGKVCDQYAGQLVGLTPFGTHRLIQMLSGEQLPRIC